jgi:hypothetical protein
MAMFKPSIMLADKIEPTPSPPLRVRIVFLIAALVFLLPLAVEAASICFGQWCEVMGQSSEVRTPIIDSIGEGLRDTRDSLAETIGPPVHRLTHDPGVALPVASAFILLAMTLLRR